MRETIIGLAVTCSTVAIFLVMSSVSVADAPPETAATPLPVIAPSIPAAYVVNVTTPEGMTAFNARWKNMDVKIVEAPAMPNGGAACRSSYDVTTTTGDATCDG